MAYYIKWNEDKTDYTVWGGASIGVKAMTERGYERVEVLPAKPEPPEPPVILSKLAIIRVLGENWGTYRERIEEAGLIDQWNAATYLDTSDPAFAPWWNALTDEERELLKAECRY